LSETIAIEFPRDVIQAARMTPDELRQELAIHLYQQGKLSFGKAREMAQMTAWAFQQLLGGRSIPVHYDIEEYEQDLAALQDLDER
jgi:predicted HTH domain antitoxin